jgi:hypothetical protein
MVYDLAERTNLNRRRPAVGDDETDFIGLAVMRSHEVVIKGEREV